MRRAPRSSVPPTSLGTTLVVDTDNKRRDAVCEALEAAGFDAIAVRTTSDAVRFARGSAIDRILLFRAHSAEADALVEAHARDPHLRTIPLHVLDESASVASLDVALRGVIEGAVRATS
jgi:hypothetical protein